MDTNIIKARVGADKPATPIVKKEAHAASLEAGKILARAEARVALLKAEAEQEKDILFAMSVEQGRAEGLNQWNDALVEVWRRRDDFLSQHEPELVKLAVAIAKKIVGHLVQNDSEVVIQTVREALKAARSAHRVTVKVNPADEGMVQERVSSFRAVNIEIGEFVIVGHSSVGVGGCIVESELGIIDARITTQLDSIEKALLRRFDVGDR